MDSHVPLAVLMDAVTRSLLLEYHALLAYPLSAGLCSCACQEGVPKEWWSIEPRFFQPKAAQPKELSFALLTFLTSDIARAEVFGAIPAVS